MTYAVVPRKAAVSAHPRLRDARLFDQFWNELGRAPKRLAGEQEARFVPHLDVSESKEAYRVQAELPGLDAQDFQVIVEDDVLTLKGEKKRGEVSESDAPRRSEALYGRFERHLRFRDAIPQEGVSATYKNGLLTVTLPKPVEAEPEVRTIPVTTA